MWLFRLVFLFIIMKVAGKIKQNVEKEIKEKINTLKGSVKENE